MLGGTLKIDDKVVTVFKVEVRGLGYGFKSVTVGEKVPTSQHQIPESLLNSGGKCYTGGHWYEFTKF